MKYVQSPIGRRKLGRMGCIERERTEREGGGADSVGTFAKIYRIDRRKLIGRFSGGCETVPPIPCEEPFFLVLLERFSFNFPASLKHLSRRPRSQNSHHGTLFSLNDKGETQREPDLGRCCLGAVAAFGCPLGAPTSVSTAW